jgi:hypothetical protein
MAMGHAKAGMARPEGNSVPDLEERREKMSMRPFGRLFSGPRNPREHLNARKGAFDDTMRALLQNGGSRVAKEGLQSLPLVPAHRIRECGARCPKHEPAALTTETEIEQLVRAVTRTHGIAIHAKGRKPLGVWRGRAVPRQSKHDRTCVGECKPAQLVVQRQPQMRVGRLRLDRRIIRLNLNRSLGTNGKLGDRAGYTGHPCALPIGERADDPAFEFIAGPRQKPRPHCQLIEPRREFVPNSEPPCVVQPDPPGDLIACASAAQTPSHGWIERAHSDTW